MRKSVKKLLSYSLTIMLVFSSFFITGCENNENNNNNNNNEEVVKKTYNVTFDTAGGSEVGSQTVTEGESVTKPVTPTKEGYEFTSWTYNGERYNFSTPVTSDITLVAEWTKKEEVWVVTLDTDDGSLTTKVNVKKGEKLEKPEDPERAGYTFVSWQLNGKDYDFNKVVEKDITLKATWKERKLKVTFDSAGGSAVKTQEIKLNGTATEPKTKPTKAGWTFVSWTLDGNNYDFKAEVTSDITLVATWKLEKKYTKEESITKKINKKNVKIDFRYLTKNEETDIDIFVNDIKAFDMPVITDTEECDLDSFCASNINALINNIKNNLIKTIKGDKEYFVFDLTSMNPSPYYIINDVGSLLHKGTGGSSQFEFEIADKNCLNYNNFENLKTEEEPWPTTYIGKDGIYELEEYTNLQIKQHKISVNKDKVTDSVVATCIGNGGDKNPDYLYIIAKTKKVNGKNVNLEYRFMHDDHINADLYINNKKVINDVYAEYFDSDNSYYNLNLMTDPYSKNETDIEILINYWKNLSTKLDENIGTIKGDKEYLYVKAQNLNTGKVSSEEVIVLNANNQIIFNKQIQDAGAYTSYRICEQVKLFDLSVADTIGIERVQAITSTGIYYAKGISAETIDIAELKQNILFNNEPNLKTFEQYEVTFKNDKATEVIDGICAGLNSSTLTYQMVH